MEVSWITIYMKELKWHPKGCLALFSSFFCWSILQIHEREKRDFLAWAPEADTSVKRKMGRICRRPNGWSTTDASFYDCLRVICKEDTERLILSFLTFGFHKQEKSEQSISYHPSLRVNDSTKDSSYLAFLRGETIAPFVHDLGASNIPTPRIWYQSICLRKWKELELLLQ